MNKLIIDCHTKGANEIVRRIRRLKSTVEVENLGEYMFPGPTGYNKLRVETSKTEEEVDRWLYTNNFDYVGVVTASEHDMPKEEE